MGVLEQLVHCQEVAFKGYVIDGFPSTATQLEDLQTWHSLFTPDYIIDLTISNEDLLDRFSSILCDPLTGIHYPSATRNKWMETREKEEEEEEETVDPEIVERLVRPLEFLEGNAERFIDNYTHNLDIEDVKKVMKQPHKYISINASQPQQDVLKQALRIFEFEAVRCIPEQFEMPINVSNETRKQISRHELSFLRSD